MLITVLAIPIALQAQAVSDWIGKRVITQYGTVLQVGNQVVDDEGRGKNITRGKEQQIFRIYKIEQANGPWLWLVAAGCGVKGWVPAANVKLFDQAIDYFTAQIRANPGAASNYIRRANVWRVRKQLDFAIADYNEAIRLDPQYALACYNRSVTYWISGKGDPAAGARRVIEIQGWRGDRSIYAVLLGHFSARRSGKAGEARKLLDEAVTQCDTSAWPYPVVRFLRGEIDGKALLTVATDSDKMTEVRCFLGLDHVLKDQPAIAMEHFLWVKNHGNPSFAQYTIAVAELEWLSQKGQPGTK